MNMYGGYSRGPIHVDSPKCDDPSNIFMTEQMSHCTHVCYNRCVLVKGLILCLRSLLPHTSG